MIDFKMALLDPSSIFKRPEDILQCQELSREQKIKVLRRWEYDMREMEVAEEENMRGGPDPDLLDAILRALSSLGADISHEHSAPTKQGGEPPPSAEDE